MIAGALQAAFGTTVVEYDQDFSPAKGATGTTVVARAMNTAAVAATNEALKQLADANPGRDTRLHGTDLAVHVGPGAVTATCVLLYEVRPILLEEVR